MKKIKQRLYPKTFSLKKHCVNYLLAKHLFIHLLPDEKYFKTSQKTKLYWLIHAKVK